MVKQTHVLGIFLTLVILSSSTYILFDDTVRYDMDKYKSTISYRGADGDWVLGGTERTQLWDGSTKMRAKDRYTTDFLNDTEYIKQRVVVYKDNIKTIQTIRFLYSESRVERIPFENYVTCFGCEGKILEFEYKDLRFIRGTKDVTSPARYGKVVIDWDERAYRAKQYDYKVSKDKLVIRYRPDEEVYTISSRMYDPPGVSNDNLVLFVRFNGTAEDYSDNDWPISFEGDVNYSTIDGITAANIYGGSNDYINISMPIDLVNDTNDISCYMVANDDSVADSARPMHYCDDANDCIMAVWDASTAYESVAFGVKSGSDIFFRRDGTTTYSEGDWAVWRMMYKASANSTSQYLNGTNNTAGASTAWSFTTSAAYYGHMVLGMRQDTNNDWTGQIAYMACWSRLLNDSEVSYLDDISNWGAPEDMFVGAESEPVLSLNLSSNLTGCYDFDANTNDYSERYNVSLVGGADYTTSLFKVGSGSFNCPGSNDAGTISASVLSSSDATIAFWEYHDASVTNDGYMISDGNDINNLFFRRLTSSDRWNGQFGDIGSGIEATLASGGWQFFTWKHYANGTGYLYVNGTKISSDTGSNFGGITSTFYLCDRQDLARDYDGKIDQLMIFDRALNDTEIADLFNSGDGRSCEYVTTLVEDVATPTPTEYYFDSVTGSDSNNGTDSSHPWKTLQKFEDSAIPDSSVLWLFANSSFLETLIIDESNLVIKKYGEGTNPEITGGVDLSSSGNWTASGTANIYNSSSSSQDMEYLWHDNTGCILVNNTGQLDSDWECWMDDTNNRVLVYHSSGSPDTQATTITANSLRTGTGSALVYSTGDNLMFDGVDIHHSGIYGLRPYLGDNITFKNGDLSWNWDKTVWTDRSNNIVFDNYTILNGSLEGFWSGSNGENLFLADGVNFTITNGLIDGAGGAGINGYRCDYFYAFNNTVRNSRHNPGYDALPGIYPEACNNSLVIQNNVTNFTVGISSNAEASGDRSENVTFKYNLLDNNYVAAVFRCNSGDKCLQDITFDHNTIYQFGDPPYNDHIMWIDDVDNLTFTNNIIHEDWDTRKSGNNLVTWYGGADVTNYTWDYNLWYQSNSSYSYYTTAYDSTFIGYQTEINDEWNSTNQSAQFVNSTAKDFRPLTDTIACNMSTGNSWVGYTACMPPEVEGDDYLNLTSFTNSSSGETWIYLTYGIEGTPSLGNITQDGSVVCTFGVGGSCGSSAENVTGLTNGTEYVFNITIIGSGVGLSDEDTFKTVTAASINPEDYINITSFTNASEGDSWVYLTYGWDGSDDSANITRNGSIICTSCGSSYNDTGLIPETEYYYVLTVTGTGDTDSSSGTFITEENTTVITEDYINLTDMTNTSASLDWIYVTMTFEGDHDSGNLTRDGSVVCTYGAGGSCGSGTYNDTSLSSNTSYEYNVTICDEGYCESLEESYTTHTAAVSASFNGTPFLNMTGDSSSVPFYDYSIYNSTFSEYGSPEMSAQAMVFSEGTCKWNDCISVNNSYFSDYWNSTIPVNIDSGFTIRFWVKHRNAPSGTHEQGYFWLGTEGTDMVTASQTNWGLRITMTNQSGSKTQFANGASYIATADSWHMYTYMHNHSLGRVFLYDNGELVLNQSWGTTNQTALTEGAPIRVGVGRYGLNSNYTMDELVMWNYSLTHEEIVEDYENQVTGSAPSLDIGIQNVSYVLPFNWSHEFNYLEMNGTLQIPITVKNFGQENVSSKSVNLSQEGVLIHQVNLSLATGEEQTILYNWTKEYGMFEFEVTIDEEAGEESLWNNKYKFIVPFVNRPFFVNMSERETAWQLCANATGELVSYQSEVCTWVYSFQANDWGWTSGNDVNSRGKEGLQNAFGCWLNNYTNPSGKYNCDRAMNHIEGWGNVSVSTYTNVQYIHSLQFVGMTYDLMFPNFTEEEYNDLTDNLESVCQQISKLENVDVVNDEENLVVGDNGFGFGSGMGGFCYLLMGTGSNPTLRLTDESVRGARSLPYEWMDRETALMKSNKNDSLGQYQEGAHYWQYMYVHKVINEFFQKKHNISVIEDEQNFMCAMAKQYLYLYLDDTYNGNDIQGTEDTNFKVIPRGDGHSYDIMGDALFPDESMITYSAAVCDDPQIRNYLYWLRIKYSEEDSFATTQSDIFLTPFLLSLGVTADDPDVNFTKKGFANSDDIAWFRTGYTYSNDSMLYVDGGEERGGGHSEAQHYMLYAIGESFLDYTQVNLYDDVRDESWKNGIAYYFHNQSVAGTDGNFGYVCGSYAYNQYYGMSTCPDEVYYNDSTQWPDYRIFPEEYGGDVRYFLGDESAHVGMVYKYTPYYNSDPVEETFVILGDRMIRYAKVANNNENLVYDVNIFLGHHFNTTAGTNNFTQQRNGTDKYMVNTLSWSSEPMDLYCKDGVQYSFVKTGSASGKGNYTRCYFVAEESDIQLIKQHSWGQGSIPQTWANVTYNSDKGVESGMSGVLFDTNEDNNITTTTRSTDGDTLIYESGMTAAMNTTSIYLDGYQIFSSNVSVPVILYAGSDNITMFISTAQPSNGMDYPVDVEVTIDAQGMDNNTNLSVVSTTQSLSTTEVDTRTTFVVSADSQGDTIVITGTGEFSFISPSVTSFTAPYKSKDWIYLDWALSGNYTNVSLSESGSVIHTGSPTLYNHTGLSQNTTYQYLLNVSYNATEYDLSYKNVTTEAFVFSEPSADTFTATSIGFTSMTLSWTGSGNITAYNLSCDGTRYLSNLSTSYLLTGLSQGQDLSCTLEAYYNTTSSDSIVLPVSTDDYSINVTSPEDGILYNVTPLTFSCEWNLEGFNTTGIELYIDDVLITGYYNFGGGYVNASTNYTFGNYPQTDGSHEVYCKIVTGGYDSDTVLYSINEVNASYSLNWSYGPDISIYYIPGCGSYYGTNTTPYGQNSSHGLHYICNDGDFAGDVVAALTANLSTGWTLNISNTSISQYEITLNMSNQTIYTNLGVNECTYLWEEWYCVNVTSGPGGYANFELI